MSAAAVEVANALKHPKVKGSRAALLKKIAELIPEGDTMTPPIATEELAALTGYYDQAIRKARDVLVDLGVVRCVGGGRGRVASYELLLLAGAGAPPALPLRADLRAVPPSVPEGPTLFDAPIGDDHDAPPSAPDAIRGNNLGEKYRPLRTIVTKVGDFHRRLRSTIVTNVGTFHRPWSRIVTNVGTFHRRVASWVQSRRAFNLGEFGTGPRPPLDDARARVLRKYKYEGGVDARARDDDDDDGGALDGTRETADAFLCWFERTYPTYHQGARCHVGVQRDGPLVWALLRGGRSVTQLQAMTECLWGITTDGVVGSDRWWIAERVTVRNIAVLHRKADFLDLAVRAAAVREPPAPADDVWVRIKARIEVTLDQHTFHTWFRDTVLVVDRGAVLEVGKPGANSELFAEWIPKHYGDLVRDAVDAERPGARVEFVAIDASRRKFG
jgi:DnaA-like protein